MLRIFVQRGDKIHFKFPDASDAMIGILNRGYLEFYFPREVKITREKRKSTELIINNQKS